jgi:ferrous iron transport protein A
MRDLSASPTALKGACSSGSAGLAGTQRLGAMRRGATGTISGLSAAPSRKSDAIDSAELERRLLEMGFVEGASFEVLHEGPIGRDPICVRVDGTRVALRRRDADALIVTLCAPNTRHHAA